MKICLIGNLGKSFNETCDEVHMRDILKSLGHTVYAYNNYEWKKALGTEPWTTEHGNTFIPIEPPIDLAIVFKGTTMSAEEAKEFREKAGVKKLIYWCPDLMEECRGDLTWEQRNPTQYDNAHTQMVRNADMYFSKELAWRTEYERLGAKFIYFHTNLAPSYTYNKDYEDKGSNFFEIAGIKEDSYPVLFTGTWTDIGENRPIFLKKLDDAIDNLHIFSYNWDCWKERNFKNVHGGAWDDTYKYLIARAKINIALDWRNDVEGYWSDRINQIMACGGFVLAKYVRGMEHEFGADGEYLVYWNTLEDLVEKIHYYLEHDEERIGIAIRGFWYTQGNLVAEERIKQMLTIAKYV